MKKKNEQAISKKKIQVWNCLSNKKVQCVTVNSFHQCILSFWIGAQVAQWI